MPVRAWEPLPDIERGAGDATDLANSIRLCRHHADELRYCPELGWLVYDGRRWTRDHCAAELLAARVAGYVLAEVATCSKLASRAATAGKRKTLADRADRLLRWAQKSASAPRIAAAMQLAEAQLAVKAEALDTHPELLNVTNGTLNLRTGELQKHNRWDFITKLVPLPYDPNSAAPRFRELVRWAMKERTALISYLQVAAGYSATGSNREQILLFAYGSGSNGKSTILGAIADTLGEDYAIRAMPELLTAAKGERHSTEMAHLRGSRMVLVSETEDGRDLAVQRMKMLTGETKVTARSMRQDPMTFKVQSTLWLQSNHRPNVVEQSRAVWRRIRVIPFSATVEDADAELPEKLIEERAGILCWIVEGAVKWYRDGLKMPPEVAAAVEDYRAASDTLGSFIADACTVREDFRAPAAALIAAYEKYCESEGTVPLNAKQIKLAMAARGHASKHLETGTVYLGLRLSTGEPRE